MPYGLPMTGCAFPVETSRSFGAGYPLRIEIPVTSDLLERFRSIGLHTEGIKRVSKEDGIYRIDRVIDRGSHIEEMYTRHSEWFIESSEGGIDAFKAHYNSEMGMDLYSGSRYFLTEATDSSCSTTEHDDTPPKRWTGDIRDVDYDEVNDYMNHEFGEEELDHFYKYEL